MLELIDTHAHLDEIENIEQVCDEARTAGIVTIVAVGSNIKANSTTLEISRKYPGLVYPALGWYPGNIKESEIDSTLAFIESHIDEVVAVGEVGLDYSKWVRAVADKDLQKKVFRELLRIAKVHGKPALIHSRYAWRDALDTVVEAGIENAVFHWYTGTSNVLRHIISHGYYLSVTPAVEYHEEHRRAVKEVPLEHMLLETDAPVVYARGREGEFRASPADVVRSLKGAAALRGMSEEEIAEATTGNARRLFGIVRQDD